MSDQPQRPKRPRDSNQLAKQVVDEATGQAEPEFEPEKDPAAVDRGRKGGRIGGLSRAEKLTEAKRKEIARHAAEARWAKKQRR